MTTRLCFQGDYFFSYSNMGNEIDDCPHWLKPLLREEGPFDSLLDSQQPDRMITVNIEVFIHDRGKPR